MSEGAENIFIEVSPGETRVAFVDRTGRLTELLVERVNRPSLMEGIYLGRVAKIEKGLGAAFVDIGTGDAAFLDRATGLHEGQSIVVQVMRDAAGGKPPALRRRIALAGRYLVFTPGGQGISVPHGAGSTQERDAIEARLAAVAQDSEGWAIRSVTIASAEFDLQGEADRLRQRWTEIVADSQRLNAPATLVEAPPLLAQVLRNRVVEDEVVIDDRAAYLAIKRLISAEMPDLAGRVHFHDATTPIFEVTGIEEQIETALDRVVPVARGGRMTFDATEAMTVVDVDMGGAGARQKSDDAIVSLNMAAAVELAYQTRLRNLAGLIVVDFITMRGKGQRRNLVEAQRRAFRGSRVPVDVLGMTAAGLVEITRRRDGPTLAEFMAQPPATGSFPSSEALACAALRATLRTTGSGKLRLRAPRRVCSLLQGALSKPFEEVKRRVGGSLALEVDDKETRFRVTSNASTK